MSELEEMITVIFVTNVVYMAISSRYLSRTSVEVHEILEQLKEKSDEK